MTMMRERQLEPEPRAEEEEVIAVIAAIADAEEEEKVGRQHLKLLVHFLLLLPRLLHFA